MKRISSLLLAGVLVLLFTTFAWGAIHDSNGDFSYWGSSSSYVLMTDTWYWVGKDNPYYVASGMTGPGNGNTLVGGEYYVNDQTFAEIWGGNGSAIKGSYLTNSGFFAGMDYHMNNANSYTLFSPGYRLNVKDGYVALSCDYASDGAAGKDYTKGFALDYKIANENYRMFGQLYHDQYLNKNYADWTYEAAAAKELVLALKLADYDKVPIFNGGLTWSPEIGIFDAKIGRNNAMNVIDLSGLFLVNQRLYLGAETVKDPQNQFTEYSDKSANLIKAKYKLGDASALELAYRLKNGSYINTMMYLGLQTNL
jgi:hypothetical protein